MARVSDTDEAHLTDLDRADEPSAVVQILRAHLLPLTGVGLAIAVGTPSVIRFVFKLREEASDIAGQPDYVMFVWIPCVSLLLVSAIWMLSSRAKKDNRIGVRIVSTFWIVIFTPFMYWGSTRDFQPDRAREVAHRKLSIYFTSGNPEWKSYATNSVRSGLITPGDLTYRLIRESTPGTEVLLVHVLETAGDRSMANGMLNSRNSILYRAAELWAERNGYSITQHRGSSSTHWKK